MPAWSKFTFTWKFREVYKARISKFPWAYVVMESMPDPFRSSLRNASARSSQDQQAKSEVMIVHGTRCSEHAHDVSKWRPTTNLATECAEKVWSEHQEFQ